MEVEEVSYIRRDLRANCRFITNKGVSVFIAVLLSEQSVNNFIIFSNKKMFIDWEGRVTLNVGTFDTRKFEILTYFYNFTSCLLALFLVLSKIYLFN